MTLGEYRVGVTFNPSGDADVHAIKRAAADLIDLIDRARSDKTDRIVAAHPTGFSYQGGDRSTPISEVQRLSALAMTGIEEAAMWAVKAVTKDPGP